MPKRSVKRRSVKRRSVKRKAKSSTSAPKGHNDLGRCKTRIAFGPYSNVKVDSRWTYIQQTSCTVAGVEGKFASAITTVDMARDWFLQARVTNGLPASISACNDPLMYFGTDVNSTGSLNFAVDGGTTLPANKNNDYYAYVKGINFDQRVKNFSVLPVRVTIKWLKYKLPHNMSPYDLAYYDITAGSQSVADAATHSTSSTGSGLLVGNVSAMTALPSDNIGMNKPLKVGAVGTTTTQIMMEQGVPYWSGEAYNHVITTLHTRTFMLQPGSEIDTSVYFPINQQFTYAEVYGNDQRFLKNTLMSIMTFQTGMVLVNDSVNVDAPQPTFTPAKMGITNTKTIYMGGGATPEKKHKFTRMAPLFVSRPSTGSYATTLVPPVNESFVSVLDEDNNVIASELNLNA